MSEIALRFLLANLAAAIAILLVIALRKPARAAFGARLAYSLWLLVPLAALGSLLPPRVVEIARPAPAMSASYPPPSFAPDFFPAPPAFTPAETPALPPAPSVDAWTPDPWTVDPWTLGVIGWFAGALAMATWLLRGQLRFLADARAGFAGPAVAGVFNPRIITPADFEDRFEKSEREVILAHERIHLDNNDARINAFAALLRCLCWFNPLVHIAAHLMRVDQELACDATVVERHPRAKAVYANALLKAQLASRPLPLGCYWPAGTEHPLTERVEMLKQAKPTLLRRRAGIAALALLAIGAGAAAWAALPPEEHIRFETPATPEPTAIATATVEPASAAAPADEPPPPPAPQMPTAAEEQYDHDDPVYLRGAIEKIDFGNKTYVAYVRASSIARDLNDAEQPDTRLWRLSPANYWGDRDAITRDLMNEIVNASGFRSLDKSCDPACAIKVTGALIKCSVPPTFAAGCSRTPGTASSQVAQPVRYEPQQSPPARQSGSRELPPPMQSPPRAIPETIVAGPPPTLDVDAMIYLRGKVEKIEFGDSKYVVFLRASSLARYPFADGNPRPSIAYASADLWEFSPTNYFGDRDSIRADLMGKNVEVNGLNLTRDCKPSCRIKVKDLLMPATSEVPAPIADAPLIAEFARWYDTTRPAIARGKVERIEFHDRVFDAYVRSEDVGPIPGRVYQVRSEYRFPRADIERELLNKTVTASGWRARENISTHCDPVCGMYATGFELANRVLLMPDGPTLLTSAYLQRPRGDFFLAIADLDSPLTVKGKITRYVPTVLGADNPQLWIEATSVEPGSTFGSTSGTMWVVTGFPFNPSADWVGRTAMLRGFNAEDKRCQPTCLMAAQSIQLEN